MVEVKLEAKDGKTAVVIGNAGTKAAAFSITIAEVAEDNSDTGDHSIIALTAGMLAVSALLVLELMVPDIRKRLFK